MTQEQHPAASNPENQSAQNDWERMGQLLSLAENGMVTDSSTLSSLAELGSQIRKHEYWAGGTTIQGTDEVVGATRHISYDHVVQGEDGEYHRYPVPEKIGERFTAFSTTHADMIPEKPANDSATIKESRSNSAHAGSASTALQQRSPRSQDGPRDWKPAEEARREPTGSQEKRSEDRRQRDEEYTARKTRQLRQRLLQRDEEPRPLPTGKAVAPPNIHADIWKKLSSAEKWQAANEYERIGRPEAVSETAWKNMDDEARWDYAHAIQNKDNEALSRLLPHHAWERQANYSDQDWSLLSSAMRRREINLAEGLIKPSKTAKQIKLESDAEQARKKAEHPSFPKHVGRIALAASVELLASARNKGSFAGNYARAIVTEAKILENTKRVGSTIANSGYDLDRKLLKPATDLDLLLGRLLVAAVVESKIPQKVIEQIERRKHK